MELAMSPTRENGGQTDLKPFLTVLLMACAVILIGAPTCAKSQEQGTAVRTVDVHGARRVYFLHAPRTQGGDTPVPLVLMFHGGGGTPAYAEQETRFNELADREGFLVAYPQGYKKSWNDGRNDKAIAAQRDRVDDLGFIAALIDDVAKDYRVDAKRVYAAGISNGAIFSHYLAVRMSTRIAAIASVAGGIAEPVSKNFSPDQPVSVVIMHGTEDPLVPYAGGDITLPWGTKRGTIIGTESAVKMWGERDGTLQKAVEEALPDADPADGCRVTKFSYAQGVDATEVVLYRIEGGGHTWPGGRQYLPVRLIGRLCRDVNATAVIWQFFKGHPKP
jgi:polyhydroxybutyrate depolymerase